LGRTVGLARFRTPRWEPPIVEVVPSGTLTQVLCLREGLGLQALAGVPPLHGSDDIKGLLLADSERRREMARLITSVWHKSLLDGGPELDAADQGWNALRHHLPDLDPEHLVGQWMIREFQPVLRRVMNQPFEDPAGVPEATSEQFVRAAVSRGLRRVIVLGLSSDYYHWTSLSGLLVIAETTRNRPSAYRQALGEI